MSPPAFADVDRSSFGGQFILGEAEDKLVELTGIEPVTS